MKAVYIIDASQSKIDYDNKGSSIVTNSSNSISKPVDIPKSRSSITTSSSQSTNADKNYIPRPKNCFMAYREHIKEKFLIENPGINNKVVSVLAANMWNNEPEDVKEHWREQTKLKDNNSSNTTNTTTTNDTTSITNCRKKNVVDSKMIFADGFNNEIMCGDDNSNNKDDVKQKQPIYSLGLEGIATADDHEDIYLQHLQKKAIFGHYRSSSVDSLSSWTSDSTVSTPLLSPFAGSPASLSPPTFQCNNSVGRSALHSKMIFADGFNNEIMCGDDNSNNKDDVKQKQPIYSLGLEGIATADDHEDIYLQHLQKKAIFGHYRSSSVDSLSSWTSDSTVSTPLLSPFAGSPASLSPPTFQCNNSVGRSALRPRRHSQQLLAEFEDGIKQQQLFNEKIHLNDNKIVGSLYSHENQKNRKYQN
ncbi:3444_t:CDS:2 [Entrophospora sp. SA101]|nr:3444_t:CDS:2 [Entrophospora sp. SA101]